MHAIVCNLKQIIAVFFIVPFLLQTFSRLLIIADYYVNTSRFAVNCENKDKPMLHCNGKCQMMKQLNKAEKSEQKNPERKLENRDEVSLFNSHHFYTIKPITFPIQKQYAGFISVSIPSKKALAIFRPPD